MSLFRQLRLRPSSFVLYQIVARTYRKICAVCDRPFSGVARLPVHDSSHYIPEARLRTDVTHKLLKSLDIVRTMAAFIDVVFEGGSSSSMHFLSMARLSSQWCRDWGHKIAQGLELCFPFQPD